MPAPQNNQNAVKPEEDKASSFLHIRCLPREKSSWVKAAGGRNLTEWATEILNRETKKENETLRSLVTEALPFMTMKSWILEAKEILKNNE